VNIVCLAAYILSIFAANWFIGHIGWCEDGFCTVPVAPGIWAPSGVLWIGVALWLRDRVQDRWGKGWTVMAIAAGGVLSAFLSPALAWASFAAFLASELLDMAVYTPLRKRHADTALVASNAVGAFVDSVLFLAIAAIPMAFLPGQVIGKLEATGIVLLVRWARRWLGRRYGVPTRNPSPELAR
jgi:uncharacterized PurR-regulated membrane protein YhhQ (DUF165 family)